jgi:hypothetical protein
MQSVFNPQQEEQPKKMAQNPPTSQQPNSTLPVSNQIKIMEDRIKSYGATGEYTAEDINGLQNEASNIKSRIELLQKQQDKYMKDHDVLASDYDGLFPDRVLLERNLERLNNIIERKMKYANYVSNGRNK